MRNLAFNTRVALGSASIVLGVLLIFAFGTVLFFRHEQFELVDMNLESVLISPLENDGLPDGLPPFVSVGLLDPDGRLMGHSSQFPVDLAAVGARRFDAVTRRTDTGEWRLQARRLENGRILVVAYDLAEVHDVMADMVQGCLVALPLLSAFAGGGAWWVSHRALRPLRLLTQTASVIAARRLDQRVAVPVAEDDVHRLALAFNAMLARLEAGFSQAERFAADASHELRTPLTIMRGEISRLLRVPELAPEMEQKLVSLQEEIGRLERITEHLLLLARFDAGQTGAERHEKLDFSALALEACEDAELLAGARGVSLSVSIGASLAVRGDELLLRRLVLNLLDNATRYNVPEGFVWCELTVADAHVQLRVRNTGPAILPDEREQLFRRFYRADAARARGGHGLGLALSREIARSHGGDLVLAPDPEPGRTEFLLTLPMGARAA